TLVPAFEREQQQVLARGEAAAPHDRIRGSLEAREGEAKVGQRGQQIAIFGRDVCGIHASGTPPLCVVLDRTAMDMPTPVDPETPLCCSSAFRSSCCSPGAARTSRRSSPPARRRATSRRSGG